MWRRKRLLKWNKLRFGQTLGSAHQESRSLNKRNFAFKMFSKSAKTGNDLSMIESQGTENEGLRPRVIWNWYNILREICTSVWMTLRPGIPLRWEKGQPEGYAVTGKTWKQGVAKKDLVSNDAAGQNNSNLASLAALVVNGEWELILAMSSHYCFYTPI
jgi:hypothetical protein